MTYPAVIGPRMVCFLFSCLGVAKNIVLSIGHHRKPGKIKPLKHRYMIKDKFSEFKNTIVDDYNIEKEDVLSVNPVENGRRFKDFNIKSLNVGADEHIKHKVIR
jgi:hypothetical protein